MATTKRDSKKHTLCPNCGHGLNAADHFCPHCGQENHDLHVPVRHLLAEAVEGFLHFDGKSFRTMAALVSKPGFLTAEFRVGRRVRYVPPVRLYVFLSFLFFVLLSFSPARHEPDPTGANGLNVTYHEISTRDLFGLTPTQVDSLMAVRHVERTPFNLLMIRQLVKIAEDGRTEFGHRLLKGISYLMFVMMPIFGLWAYLFFRKKAAYYVDCLVYSVHFHCFAFLFLTIITSLRFVKDAEWLILASPLVLLGYNYLALRRVFGEKRLRTALKTVGLTVLYTISLVLGMGAMIFVNLLLF